MSLPLPLRPLQCSNPDCGLPDGGRCARAGTIEHPLEECPDLARGGDSEPLTEDEHADERTEELATHDVDSEPAPWSGRHLSLPEAEHMMGSSPCRVIAILGPYNAGKTCLLTSMFLQMANGGTRTGFPYAFAGSSSLHAFLNLARQASRYQGRPQEQVVDHTAITDPQDAGVFLHLALRPRDPADERVVHTLLTDIPGEWFDEYASQEDARSARRLSFLSRCDGFMILADSDALMAEAGGRIDSRTHLMLRRLSKNMAEWDRVAPVCFVLSKYDRVWSEVGDPPGPDDALNPRSWGRLGLRLRRTLKALQDMQAQGVRVRVAATSAVPRPLDQGQPIGVVEPFAWMLSQVDIRRRHARSRPPVPVNARPFVTMHRESAP